MMGTRDFCGNKHLACSGIALESSEPLASLWVEGLSQLEVSGCCSQVRAVLEHSMAPSAHLLGNGVEMNMW